jgi:plasmid stabilization system protein ParE
MNYTIIFSNTAVETFDSIREQIYNRWGDISVIDFEQRTLKVLELIERSPFIFQSIPISENIRKGFIHRNCSMFYEIREHRIEILFFWDNRQDPIFS